MRKTFWALYLLGSVSALSLPVAPVLADSPSRQHQPISFSADQVKYDYEAQRVEALGNVILRQRGQALYADRIIYQQDSGQVKAYGNVRLQDKNGNLISIDNAELSEGFRQGFIENIRILLADGSRLAAVTGERSGEKTILEKAVYSPCKVCGDQGGRPPIWQIKARKVVHDNDDRTVKYKDASLEVMGVPVLYTPYFSHADPTVHARSGLLTPSAGNSTELGVYLKTPYYIRLARDKDLTLTPLFTEQESVVLSGDYRQHMGNGIARLGGSITYVDDRDNNNIKTGETKVKGYVYSDGQFALNKLPGLHGGMWQWDYNLEWVSDDTYLRRYDFSKADTLTSHARIAHFQQQNYAALSIYGFQGLRLEDASGRTAHALPLLDMHFETSPKSIAGTFYANINGVALARTKGRDSQRLSVEGGWTHAFRSSLGDQYRLSVSLRGDIYNFTDSDQPDSPLYDSEDGEELRALPRVALDWSWPWMRQGMDTQQVIEPIFSLILAPEDKNPGAIANEDSRSFEFDDSNLFSHNRFTGYDLWESGSRMSYGVRYTLASQKLNIIAVMGQSYRISDEQIFPQGTGFDGKFSDIVGRVDVSYGDHIDYVHRLRFNEKSFELQRNEMILHAKIWRFRATVGYLDLDRDQDLNIPPTELKDRKEIRLGGELKMSSHWRAKGNWVRDLKGDGNTISYDGGLFYRDECIDFGISYKRRFTSDRDIEPSKSIGLRLVLRNLG
ncbi:MAG: hypothetical protein CMF31_10080 [Kordiimonas sp.]|nr:hypothetical protein [Kordiimonas sp.]